MDSLKYKRRRPTNIISNGGKKNFFHEVKEIILSGEEPQEEAYIEGNSLIVFENQIQNHTLSANGFSISGHMLII